MADAPPSSTSCESVNKIRILSFPSGRIHIIQPLRVFLPSLLGAVPPYVPCALSPWSKRYSFSKPSAKRGQERSCWGRTAPGTGDVHISPPSLVRTCHTVWSILAPTTPVLPRGSARLEVSGLHPVSSRGPGTLSELHHSFLKCNK